MIIFETKIVLEEGTTGRKKNMVHKAWCIVFLAWFLGRSHVCRNPRAVDPSGKTSRRFRRFQRFRRFRSGERGREAAWRSGWIGGLRGRRADRWKNEGSIVENGHRWCLAWFTMQRRPFHMGMILFNSPQRPDRVSNDLYTLLSTHRFDFYQQVLSSLHLSLNFFQLCIDRLLFTYQMVKVTQITKVNNKVFINLV